MGDNHVPHMVKQGRMTDCFGVVKDMGTRINQQIVIYQCRRKPTEKSVRAVCIDVPVGGAGAKEEQFHIFYSFLHS